MNWRPDLTFLPAARDGNHMTATHTAVPAAFHMPLAHAMATAAAAAAAEEYRKYGNALPHIMLPFIAGHVHADGINKEGAGFFRTCTKNAPNIPHVKETEASTWHSRGLPHCFLQSRSL